MLMNFRTPTLKAASFSHLTSSSHLTPSIGANMINIKLFMSLLCAKSSILIDSYKLDIIFFNKFNEPIK